MFVSSVSEVCFKCFIYLQMYVTTVASGCFKSRSGVCTCCNITRLLQPLEGAEGSGGARMPRGVGWGLRRLVGLAQGEVQAQASGRVRPSGCPSANIAVNNTMVFKTLRSATKSKWYFTKLWYFPIKL